jgi:DNA repair exonuclease SbcCD nuclease subunit
MRFLQTSDWQLGLAIKQLGEQAPLAREQHLETARRTMDLAKSEGVDFVVLAGDTFDSHEIDNLVVERAVEILSTIADLPVFVLCRATTTRWWLE